MTQRIHFVGIKGAGMSALAQIAGKMARAVITGSDTEQVYFTDKLLQREGIEVRPFAPANVDEADIVVHSPAYGAEHPEIRRARTLGLPVYSYPEFLGRLMAEKNGICIAGTHGKTTTTAMIGKIMLDARLDPCLLVGSEVPCLSGNALVGAGDYFVIEACEYRRHFLNYAPLFLVITNIELDHPDYFHNIEDVTAAFAEFAGALPAAGGLIIWDEEPRRLDMRTPATVTTFGFGAGADVRAVNAEFSGGGSRCDVHVDGRPAGRLDLPLPGRHNILNALAAAALTMRLGVPPEQALAALTGFNGTKRRFETLGRRNGALVVDDYAHHPTEIRATLNAARLSYPRRRIRAVFQPHTYSRTRRLLPDFALSFSEADEVVLAEIFPSARESREEQQLSSRRLAELIADSGVRARYFPTLAEITAYLCRTLRSDDLVLTLGAGDVYRVAEDLLPAAGEPAAKAVSENR
ncbi:MAG: UDP-N-acetylmuramate--L-alanine ligase [Gracilibacteraceae bacterium]|nr:UDP-N-acetylmuramate--L-alanine ligase [Gracilibacteraceae bacterium]